MKLLIINGPNLNLLGVREPDIYGKDSYDELVRRIFEHATARGVTVDIFQSNHEGAIVDRIQQAYAEQVDGIVINPAAYTHTSVAIADALKAVSIPTVEVHISAVEKREAFRQISYVRDVAVHTITGHGFDGYTEAMDLLIDRAGHEHEG
ncbi:MAG: type II 3-dehydroquinate dehydratase [Eubacteriales bacterium]|nr:type II 3-dehydroquinate dehydratase [Eubacteriales bacterium]